MKKMKSTTNSNPTSEFVYSSLLDEILVNDIYPKFDLSWESCHYRESHLSTIKERDHSLEFRLKLVNSLVMEYHIHRHWVTHHDGWGNPHSYLYDANPFMSKTVLLRALNYMEIILEKVFKVGQNPHREYSILAASLAFEICNELKNYGIYRNPMKALQKLQSAS